MKIGVVIVTYNRLEKLKIALESYEKQKVKPKYILVVNNNSNDGTKEYLEQWKEKNNDIEKFLSLVNESGNSSCELLQNLYSNKNPLNQEIPLAIAMSKKILKGKGAVRVHGGGFAGTIQAFVPNELVKQYKTSIEEIFGKDTCLELNIRPLGGVEIKK